MQRYGTPQYALLRQPRPADRELRYTLPKDRSAQRPRREVKRNV